MTTALTTYQPQSSYKIIKSDTDTGLIKSWLMGKADSTIKVYSATIKRFMMATGSSLRDLTLDDLQNWYESMVDRKYKPTTVAQKLATVKSLLTFGHKVGYLKINLGLFFRSKKQHTKRSQKLVKQDELTTLLAHIKSVNYKHYLMFLLNYKLALRVSEVIRLKKSDFFQVGDGSYKVNVFGKGSKEREINIGVNTLSELLPYLEALGEDEKLFTSSRQSLHRLLKKYCKQVGLGDKISSHWLRHTAATTMIKNGASYHQVQKYLGHESLNTTMVYLECIEGDNAGKYID